jgi:hypothetical protein
MFSWFHRLDAGYPRPNLHEVRLAILQSLVDLATNIKFF